MPEELPITFVQVQADNVGELRALNIALFPVKYQVSVLANSLAFARLYNFAV